MSNNLLINTLYWLLLLGLSISLTGQSQTVGLTLNDTSSFPGYTLFAPITYTTTYLINNEGLQVNTWQSKYTPGLSAYLLQNGNLLRTARLGYCTFSGGGLGGLIQEFTWEGAKVWEYEYSTDLWCQHHDIEKMPNGNILLIAWEYKEYEDVLQAGRNPDLLSQHYLWPDHIIEVEPDGPTGGKVVWEWHVWDHLIQDYDSTMDNYGVIAQHPELVDVNYVNPGPNSTKADWNHINSIDYNEKLDQVLLTVAKFSEIWIIDHSTTTLEAAGHTGGKSGKGGDLLYRWGNPQTYQRGENNERKLFAPHDAHWIESGLPGEGNILIFNNGKRRPAGPYSSIDEIVTWIDQQGKYLLNNDSIDLPDNLHWTYTKPDHTSFFASNLSGAQRLPNGNTLICDGPGGVLFEVTTEGEIVWEYINPVIKSGPLTQGHTIPSQQNRVFKTHRYAPDYPGFLGLELSPGDQIENIPTSNLAIGKELNSVYDRKIKIYPIPTIDIVTIKHGRSEQFKIIISGINGQEIFIDQMEGTTHQLDLSSFRKGIYFITIRSKDFVTTRKIIKL